MKSIAKFIIKNRIVIFILMLIFTVVCGIWIGKVNINNDMTKYLADSSNMKKGIDIMSEQFSDLETTNSIRVMFTDLKDDRKDSIKKELENIKNVESVDYEKDSKQYNKDKYTLYIVRTEYDYYSEEETAIREAIDNKYQDYNYKVINNGNKATLSIHVMVLAVVLMMIILFIMSKSWIEPLLFLIVIGMAVVINMGTNIFRSSVSATTFSIAAVLQLALSMDYSIILINRYRQEKHNTNSNKEAMINALTKAFSSITSSAFTTFIGLLVLIFMRYKLGEDLGIVLAKGVLCSWLSVFLILPVLILAFDKLIVKTAKKSPHIPMDKIASLSYKFKRVMPIMFLVLFAVAFLLQQQTGFMFTTVGEDEISEIFPKENTIVTVYNNADADNVEKVVDRIKNEDKVNSVVSYPTTIGKKVKVEEMTDMVDDYSDQMDMTIDESLLKILYYDYYVDDDLPNMSLSTLINFISDDVLENETMAKNLDSSMKKQIKSIKKFANKEKLTKKMTVKELAKLLSIKEAELKSLFVLYYSQEEEMATSSMTLKKFVDFIISDVMNNKDYSSMFNKSTKDQIKLLSNYTDKNKMTKKMSYTEAAKLLGIDSDTVKLLYVYYYGNDKNYVPGKMTIKQFTDFMLNKVAKNKTFAGYFDKKTISKISTMKTYTDKKVITSKITSDKMAKLLGMDKSMIELVYSFYYGSNKSTSESTLTVTKFINFIADVVMPNPMFSSYFDKTTKASINNMKQMIAIATSGKALTATELAATFGMNEEQVTMLMSLAGTDKMTLPQFTNYMVSVVLANETYASMIDAATAAQLQALNQMMQVVTMGAKFSSSQMSSMLNIDKSLVSTLYTYYFGCTTNNKTMTPISLVQFLLDAKKNGSPIGSTISKDVVSQLNMLQQIMKLTVNGTKLSYAKLASMFGIDKATMKLLFTLKDSYGDTSKWKLSMQTIVNYLVANNKLLGDKMSKSSLEELKLVKSIINGTVKGTKYSYKDMSKLLGINKKQVKQLYLLYISKYGDTSKWGTSLQKLVNFLADKVLKDKTYSDVFGDDIADTINSLKVIIDSVISNKKYSANESYNLIKDFTSDITSDTMELLYVYYGSVKDYDKNWKMSIELLFNHLADNIVNDKRFDKFIDADAKKQIKDLKKTLKKGINSLVGKDYSILMISTSYRDESDETYKFISQLEDTCNNGFGKDYYMVGNSVMNYEMKNTFNQEIILMTLLTIIAIFSIVAITFRSIVIPTMLVAIVQCAVYVTVASSGLRGDPLHFIAYLMVQCILMGATIDYAILFTNYYKENRGTGLGIKEALKAAYAGSIHTIFTSGAILVAVTGIMGAFMDDVVGQTCKTIAVGSFVAILLILFVLPGTIAVFDKVVLRRKNKN